MTESHLPSEDRTTIVLVGSFNPRIFQPSWFVRQQLLPPLDEEEAQVDLINNDFCAFQTSLYRIEVLSERFAAHSLAAPVVDLLRDLVQGTFEILKHNPVLKVGINTSGHFQLNSFDQYNSFGHHLAPKHDLWKPILDNPKTLSVLIQGRRVEGLYPGHINVKVEPSTRIANGVFIETNDEFQNDAATDASWLSTLLVEEWPNSLDRVRDIRRHLIQRATELEHIDD
jgi:hypothetical protein